MSVNDGRGPYVFKIHGQLSHLAGSLLPAGPAQPNGDPPTPVYAKAEHESGSPMDLHR